MKSKTIALAAAAIAAALTIGAAPVQAQLPSLAGPPAPAAADNGQKLTNARGYSLTVPSDWIVATDYEGADFMMGNADLSVICQMFSAPDVLDATDEEIRASLGTGDIGADLFTKLLFTGAPELAFVSTGPQNDHPSGWPFQRAVATLKLDTTPTTAFAYLTFKARTAYFGACFTESAKLAAGKASMESVIGSIRLTK